MFIEIHAIQSLPPSNPNRGRDGDIKTVTYGGVLRSRLSSQSQKRATREWYRDNAGLDRTQLARRSRNWHTELAPKLLWAPEEHRENIAKILLMVFNSGADSLMKSCVECKNLLFLADHEIDKLAAIGETESELLLELSAMLNEFIEHSADTSSKKTGFVHPTKKQIQPLANAISKNLTNSIAGDVALFGRMMATLTETSVDGSVQVAHAISVNSCPRTKSDSWHSGEVDFFSAQDDMQIDSDSGAGMIGEVSYHAPVHYRYANIAVNEVVKLMGDRDAASKSISAFIEGFIRSLPTGHSRQFAHGTLPEFVMLTARRDCPYALTSAFECPIDNPIADKSISQLAVKKLLDRRSDMLRVYGADGIISNSIVALDSHFVGGVSLEAAIAQTHSAIFSAETTAA